MVAKIFDLMQQIAEEDEGQAIYYLQLYPDGRGVLKFASCDDGSPEWSNMTSWETLEEGCEKMQNIL